MKNKTFASLSALTLGCIFAIGAHAQTITNISMLNFYQQAAQWGSSFNQDADHNWTNNSTIQIETGIATTTGVGISDRLYLQYNLNPKFGIGIMGQFVGIGSSFGAMEGTFEYALMQKYDFKLGAGLGVGYDFNAAKTSGQRVGGIMVEPYLFAAKKMTVNTFASIKYLMPVTGVGKFNSSGVFYIGLGSTF